MVKYGIVVCCYGKIGIVVCCYDKIQYSSVLLW